MEGDDYNMAAMKKFKAPSVQYIIMHNTRSYGNKKPSNEEIDFSRSKDNYYLTPESHGRTPKEIKEYYKETIAQYYQYGSKRLVTAVEWICTAPKGLSEDQRREFFKTTYDFLNSLYGEDNCFLAIVHKDEKVFDFKGNKVHGEDHLHYSFIPAVKVSNKNPRYKVSHYEYKICADTLFKKKDLLQFHPLYQQYLDTHLDFKCVVHKSEIGKSYLQNYKSVEHLKDQTKINLARDRIRELEETIERSHEREHTWGGSSDWGSSTWGKN